MTLVNCTPGSSRTAPTWKNMWSPFENELFRMPGMHNTMPAVNVKETPTAFQIELAAPGLTKDAFSVKVEKNVLTISANVEKSAEAEGSTWTRKEFSFSTFERSFKLPETVTLDNITGKYENGILLLMIPKREEVKEKPAREISIG